MKELFVIPPTGKEGRGSSLFQLVQVSVAYWLDIKLADAFDISYLWTLRVNPSRSIELYWYHVTLCHIRISNMTQSHRYFCKYLLYIYFIFVYRIQSKIGCWFGGHFCKKNLMPSITIKKTKWNLLYIRKRVYFHKNSVWLAYFKYKRVKFVRIYSKIGQKPSFCRKILQTLHQ